MSGNAARILSLIDPTSADPRERLIVCYPH